MPGVGLRQHGVQAMRTQLVAVVGGSGSGKTWLADRLQAAAGARCGRLSLDDFYRDLSHLSWKRRTQVNFDHPRAIDWPLFHRVLEELQHGQKVELPQYDFATHTRRPTGRLLEPRDLMLVDGLWLLHRAEVRSRFAWSIFLRCSADVRLQRRLARDLAERGRDRASVARQFRRTVQPMHQRFVAPQRRHADLVLRSPVRIAEVHALAAQLRTFADPHLCPGGRAAPVEC